jgi:hypothetical protein
VPRPCPPISAPCCPRRLPPDATVLGRAIRQHWQVENRLHRVLDVVFREDACRVRVGDGTHNLAILRPLSLHLLRQEPTRRGSLATKRFRAALDDTYLRRLLAGLDRLPSDQTASPT